MGRSRSREYRVTVGIQDVLYSSTTVNKAVYDRELLALKRLVSKIGDPSIAVGRIEVEDREDVIAATYKVTFATTTIELTANVCKPGYAFVDKSNLPERKDSRHEKQ